MPASSAAADARKDGSAAIWDWAEEFEAMQADREIARENALKSKMQMMFDEVRVSDAQARKQDNEYLMQKIDGRLQALEVQRVQDMADMNKKMDAIQNALLKLTAQQGDSGMDLDKSEDQFAYKPKRARPSSPAVPANAMWSDVGDMDTIDPGSYSALRAAAVGPPVSNCIDVEDPGLMSMVPGK